MASAGSLIFELAADVSRLRTDMGKAAKEISGSLESIKKTSAAQAIMTGADYALNFAKGFADRIRAAVDQADAMGKLAQRIGTSTEAISGLNYAAGFAGVSLDDLTTSFKGLNKALLDSRDPASDAAAAFKALGLDAAQLRAMDPSDAMKRIATSLSGFKDGAEKAAVATALFGKQGQALIPLLNQGADGIAKFTDEAQRMGLIVSHETAQAMGDLNDDIARFEKQSEGAAAILARELQPAFHEVIEIMKQAQAEGTTWNSVLNGIAITAKAVIGTLVGLAGTVTALGKLIHGFAQILNQPINAEGMAKAGEIWRDSMSSAQKTMKDTEASMTKIIHVQTAAEKEAAGLSAAWGIVGKRAEASGKETLKYSDQLDKNAASHKKAKQAVDEYARMLESLQQTYRQIVAQGDPMKTLTLDPKYQAMTEQQQANLRKQVEANEEAQRAIDAVTSAKDAQQAADDFAYEQGAKDLQQQLDQADAMWDLVDATKAAVDPTIAYAQAVEQLNSIQDKLSPEEYAKRMKQLGDDLAKAQNKMDPLAESLKSLQQAVEGFGKKASDAFVNFIFATDDVSESFAEMTASILRDLAKMLVYQNVMSPIFSKISSGVSGFDWASLFGGGRMGGGPVSAGRMYRVNEIPGRTEYFLPNVPGRIVTDANAGAGGGGTSVTVNVHMSKDDRATQETTANERETAELGNRIATVVRSVIAQEKRSGGLLAAR
ncbi:hypothetical protein [Caballeronia sp. ATUFL_F1_KS39]|uniref:hypothetical protein n=1 Tax=Caballeronia sp. ATUFL_F1_KS39 TaxID=2921766 RepID=UPI0020295F03|nr:hypothetical protein [Caballeronia sp. ATUFL_F1_KS39]